jgi:MYXO-CTERM domain-containing protein
MRFLLPLLLLPAVAAGQTPTPTTPALTVALPDAAATSKSFNSCAANITLTVQVAQGTQLCASSNAVVWVVPGTGGCATTPPDGNSTSAWRVEVTPAELTQSPAKTVSFTLDQVPLPPTGDAATPCPAERATRTYKACGAYKSLVNSGFGIATCATDYTAGRGVTLVYDTQPPAAPEIEVVPRDGALQLNVLSAEDGASIDYEVFRADADGGGEVKVAADNIPATTRSRIITGLQNTVPYRVVAYARDAADNRSDTAGEGTGTPILTCGFFCAHQGEPSEPTSAEGGCTTGAGLLAPLALAAAIFLRRRQ